MYFLYLYNLINRKKESIIICIILYKLYYIKYIFVFLIFKSYKYIC